MPQTSDKIRVRFISLLRGQPIQQHQYYDVASIIGAPTLNDIVSDVANAYWDSIKNFITSNMALSCVVWENLTRTEKNIIYPAALTGLSGAADHPQMSVLNWEIYAPDPVTPTNPMRRSRTRLSGVTEPRSKSGRLENPDTVISFTNFLRNRLQTDPVNGINLDPQVRWRTNPGVSPPAYDYWTVNEAVPNAIFTELGSRKPNLCG